MQGVNINNKLYFSKSKPLNSKYMVGPFICIDHSFILSGSGALPGKMLLSKISWGVVFPKLYH